MVRERRRVLVGGVLAERQWARKNIHLKDVFRPLELVELGH